MTLASSWTLSRFQGVFLGTLRVSRAQAGFFRESDRLRESLRHIQGKILNRTQMSTLQLDEIKKRQRAQWDASAPGWKKWERKFIHNLQPLTDMLIRNAGIKPGYSVLDLACGTGEPALSIAKIVGPSGRVVGVDIASAMINVAKERMAAQGLKNVTFQLNEHDDLPALHDR